jgi:mannose-6-phosphate isomerase-like protein (cupin superfamily)
MTKPNEDFHSGRPASSEEERLRSTGVRTKGQVFHVESAPAFTDYGGELRIPVHPLAGSVSAMAISYKLEPGEKSRVIVLSMSECGLNVVQGQGKIWIGETAHEFAVGDLAFVPVQARFSVANTGNEPLVLLGLISPPDPNMLRAAGLWLE